MGWIVYIIVVLAVSVLVGLHLGRFREAYTEMTGMMAGMAMGMMNGFVLGFAVEAALVSVLRMSNTVSLFWANIAGIGLGLLLGAYFGRAGGLMGIMDGALGGVMGGSMGAMLAAMLTFPEELLFWTAIPLSMVYLASMAALVVLIERSAPGHAALHRLAPYFTRAVAEEATEQAERVEASRARIDDYYEFLGIPRNAGDEAINEAYLAKLAVGGPADVQRADRALAILTDPAKRKSYDSKLAPSDRPDCCPPPKKKAVTAASAAAVSEKPTPYAVASASPTSQPQTAKSGNGRGKKQPTPASSVKGSRSQPARKQSSNRGPIIGGLLVLVLAGVVVAWQIGMALSSPGQAGATGAGTVAITDSGSVLPPEFVQKLEAEAVAVPESADGKQTLDLTIFGDTMSYAPNVIKVKQGVPVRFNLNIGPGRDPGCGRFVGIRSLGVGGTAKPGEVTEMEFTPGKAGVFQINCGMQMMEPGYLIVTQ
jgi:hypothetical protein